MDWKDLSRWTAAILFGLFGVIQLCITRRYLYADVFFIAVALGLSFGVLPVTNYFRKKA